MLSPKRRRLTVHCNTVSEMLPQQDFGSKKEKLQGPPRKYAHRRDDGLFMRGAWSIFVVELFIADS